MIDKYTLLELDRNTDSLEHFTTAIKSLVATPKNPVLNVYENGNHFTAILNNGTRIHGTSDNSGKLTYDFAESADVKITNYCNAGCPYCHENSSTEGQHAKLFDENGELIPIFKTWKPGAEIAVGGGNALAHPDIYKFLVEMKKVGAVCNITINQKHLQEFQNDLKKYLSEGLIHGIGVSLTDSTNEKDLKIIDKLSKLSNDTLVLHVIAGIFSPKDIDAVKNRKVLVLGYKHNVGRGTSFSESHEAEIVKNIEWLKKILPVFKYTVKVLTFDNLALAQLNAKETLKLSDAEWNLRFQGKDYGSIDEQKAPATFYFDAVKGYIGRSSTQPYEQRVAYKNESFEEAFKVSLSNYKINDSNYGELKV